MQFEFQPQGEGFLSARDAETLARKNWERVAENLGLDQSLFTSKIIRSRINEGSPRIVMRIDGPDHPQFVFKMGLNPSKADVLKHEVAAQKYATGLFLNDDKFHVPEIIHVDEVNQILLMEHVEGLTAHDNLLLGKSSEGRANVLCQCGQWIGKLHERSKIRENIVNPNAVIKHLRSMKEKVDTGVVRVAGRKKYLSYVPKAIEMAETARGKITTLATAHGDMNLRNIVLGPKGVSVFDFNDTKILPIGHDLARFFVAFGNFFFPNGSKSTDWFETDLNSFFEGYGPQHRFDPSFTYLMGVQILNDWAKIPKKKEMRNNLHVRRWAGLQTLAQLVFE